MPDRYDRKKSFRELDAKRDRSGGTTGPKQEKNPFEVNARASKQYRAALDQLFAKGEVGKLADKLSAPPGKPESRTTVRAAAPSAKQAEGDDTRATLRKKVLETTGRDSISRVFDRYSKKFGMEDFEILEQGLEHSNDDRAMEVIAALTALLKKEKPKRSRTLQSKLRFIEETSDNRELKERAAEARKILG